MLKNPAQRSDITGDVPSRSDAAVGARGRAGARTAERHVRLSAGPRVVALGYEATRRQGKAASRALASRCRRRARTPTAARRRPRASSSCPAGRRPVVLRSAGSAAHVDLRQPARLDGAPKLDTDPVRRRVHVKRHRARRSSGTRHARTQSNVEGATIASRHRRRVRASRPSLRLCGQGERHGPGPAASRQAFEIRGARRRPSTPAASTAHFDVKARGPSLEELKLSATGTLTDSAMWGTHVPRR